MITIEIKTRVPAFPNIAAVKAAQQAKKDQLEADLYPRDGSRELFQLERTVAGLLGVRSGHVLLYNTGMSAVVDALEITRPTVGTKILRGAQCYSQAGKYVSDELRTRGATVLETDHGSIEALNAIIAARRPDILFAETVTNGSDMAVLDIEALLRLPSLQEVDPLIILDNTLPTSTGVPLGTILATSDRRIIGVESGTKFIGLNSEMCGIAYTYDADLLSLLRKRRQRTGSLLSASAVETIREGMPQTAADYHVRNSAIFKHTLRLARTCLNSQRETGDSFAVAHPNLPNHPNNQYADAYFPTGISPVFFITPPGFDFQEGWQYSIAKQLWTHPDIRLLCDLGQSFGFDRSRIWPDDNAAVVRISGGNYSESEQTRLDQAFAEVLSILE